MSDQHLADAADKPETSENPISGEDPTGCYRLYNISEEITWLPDMKEPDFLLDPQIRPRVTGRGALEFFADRELSDAEIREILTEKSRELGSNYIIDIRKHLPGRFPLLSFCSFKHQNAALRITAILLLAARESGRTNNEQTRDINYYYITCRSENTAHLLKRLPPPMEDKAGLLISIIAGLFFSAVIFLGTGWIFIK